LGNASLNFFKETTEFTEGFIDDDPEILNELRLIFSELSKYIMFWL
jgi:hypothetical protein